ncbi:hypothetical protein WBU96_19540 [Bacillus albus]
MMSSMNVQPVPNDLRYPYFRKMDGSISIWDDPSVKGGIVLIDGYQPLTNLGAVLGKANSYNYMEEIDIVLLKMVGDCIAVNENQLKRLMSTKTTRSQVSLRLKKLRRHGFVHRWEISSSEDKENKPPAPFTLGLAGYIFLKHYYSKQFFMEPTRWQTLGVSAVQRYVAINEIRCQTYESQCLRDFKWNGVILNNPQLYHGFSVMEILTPQGNINFVVERVQQGKDFLSYLRTRLIKWEMVYQQHNYLPIDDMNRNKSTIAISVSCKELADNILKQLDIGKFKLPIMFCIEELQESLGLAHSFYMPFYEETKENTILKKVDMPFFD